MKVYKNKLICGICNKEYKHLGSHIVKSHKITARDYKVMFGLDYNTPLITKDIYIKKSKHFNENRKKYLKNFLSSGKRFLFKKGIGGEREYFSKQSIEHNTEIIKRQKVKGICYVCGLKYDNIYSHLFNKHRLVKVK